MSPRQPWITGAAFAFTVAVVNIACAIAVLFYPDAILQLANSWAHGIDFTMMRRAADNPLSFSEWAVGFVTSAVFAFVIGVIYRWSLNVIARFSATTHHAPLRTSSHA